MKKTTLLVTIAGAILFAGLTSPAAQAAMCGTSPATTSSGYYCSNYCRSSLSCANYCCDYLLEDDWGQTTCGASPYPCTWPPGYFCGDGYCQSSDEGVCPEDCGSGTDAVSNSTVPDFLDEFDRERDRTYLSIWECDGAGDCTSQVPVGSWWVAMQELTKCHTQGFGRLPLEPEWFVFASTTMAGEKGLISPFVGCPDPTQSNVNAGLGSFLYLVRLESKAGRGTGELGSNRLVSGFAGSAPQVDATRSVLQLNVNAAGITGAEFLYHPGGLQVIGDYVLVGTDDRGRFGNGTDSVVWLVDVSNPESPFIEPAATLRDPQDGAESVGIVRLEDETYLMVKGSRSSKLVKWYRSTTTDITHPNWQPAMTWDLRNSITVSIGNNHYATFLQWENYQAINLYREEGTNEIYLVGTYNPGQGAIGGENWGSAWRLVCHEPNLTVTTGCQFYGVHQDGHNFHDGDDAYNFAAGASLYVHPTRGTLHMYAIEHTPENCPPWGWEDCYFRFGEMW